MGVRCGESTAFIVWLVCILPPESDTVWKSDTEEGKIPVGRLSLSLYHSHINQQNNIHYQCVDNGRYCNNVIVEYKRATGNGNCLCGICIPISIMSVRCSFRLRYMDFDSSTPPPIASRIRTEMQIPSLPNWSVMVEWCCMKKIVASRISAGKAIFDNVL